MGAAADLSPVRRQANTRTKAVLLSIGLLGTNFTLSRISIYQPFCSGLNVFLVILQVILTPGYMYFYRTDRAKICYINTLRPEQYGRHFADDISNQTYKQCVYFIYILLRFVPMGPIDDKPPSVHTMLGAKQAPSHYYLNQWWQSLLMYTYTSIGLSELVKQHIWGIRYVTKRSSLGLFFWYPIILLTLLHVFLWGFWKSGMVSI